MDPEQEVIAILLDDGDEDWPEDGFDLESTTCLMRSPDGLISLSSADSQESLERSAEQSGVFRRGEPIIDPATGDVMGYELEEIDPIYSLGS